MSNVILSTALRALATVAIFVAALVGLVLLVG